MVDNEFKNNTTYILKQVDLKFIVIKLRNDSILQFDFKPCEDFSVDDLKETNLAADKLGNNKLYPRLIIMDHFINFGREVRAYSASEESNITTIAAAFVVNLVALRFVGNLYISFNKPARPTKLFNSEEMAIEWLKTFL